jgi:IS5 family transposase
MKAHIGVDAESGLVHTLVTTAANVHDVTQAQDLLHGEETDVFADSGYRGVEKREEAKDLQVNWHIAMMPAKRRALNLETAFGQLRNAAERVKAGIRAKVEHPFRVIKCQFGFTKVRYRGLAKNTARLHTLFALSNLWMVRRHFLQEMTG